MLSKILFFFLLFSGSSFAVEYEMVARMEKPVSEYETVCKYLKVVNMIHEMERKDNLTEEEKER